MKKRRISLLVLAFFLLSALTPAWGASLKESLKEILLWYAVPKEIHSVIVQGNIKLDDFAIPDNGRPGQVKPELKNIALNYDLSFHAPDRKAFIDIRVDSVSASFRLTGYVLPNQVIVDMDSLRSLMQLIDPGMAAKLPKDKKYLVTDAKYAPAIEAGWAEFQKELQKSQSDPEFRELAREWIDFIVDALPDKTVVNENNAVGISIDHQRLKETINSLIQAVINDPEKVEHLYNGFRREIKKNLDIEPDQEQAQQASKAMDVAAVDPEQIKTGARRIQERLEKFYQELDRTIRLNQYKINYRWLGANHLKTSLVFDLDLLPDSPGGKKGHIRVSSEENYRLNQNFNMASPTLSPSSTITFDELEKLLAPPKTEPDNPNQATVAPPMPEALTGFAEAASYLPSL